MFGVHMFFKIQGQNSKCSCGGVLPQLSPRAWPDISSVLLDSELGVMAKEGKGAREAKEAKKEKKAKKAAKEAKKAKKAATETNDAGVA